MWGDGGGQGQTGERTRRAVAGLWKRRFIGEKFCACLSAREGERDVRSFNEIMGMEQDASVWVPAFFERNDERHKEI